MEGGGHIVSAQAVVILPDITTGTVKMSDQVRHHKTWININLVCKMPAHWAFKQN